MPYSILRLSAPFFSLSGLGFEGEGMQFGFCDWEGFGGSGFDDVEWLGEWGLGSSGVCLSMETDSRRGLATWVL